MTSQTTTSDHSARWSFAPVRGGVAWSVLGWTAVLATFLLVGRQLEPPPYVERIVIENPSRFDVYVDVTDEGRNGWMAVGGSTRRASSTSVEDVIDQGDVWIFRFRAQGEDGGELRLTRQELVGNQWRIRIPGRVNEQLLASGVSFPP